jgi:hypothetical protein
MVVVSDFTTAGPRTLAARAPKVEHRNLQNPAAANIP